MAFGGSAATTVVVTLVLALALGCQPRAAYAQQATTTTTTTTTDTAAAVAATAATTTTTTPPPAVAVPATPQSPAAAAPTPAPAPAPAPAVAAPAAVTVTAPPKNDTRQEEKDRAMKQKLAAAQLEIVKLRMEMEEFQEMQKQKKKSRKRGPPGEEPAGSVIDPKLPVAFPSGRGRGPMGPILPFQPFRGRDAAMQQWITIMKSVMSEKGRKKDDALTVVDWGSHNGFFSLSFAYGLPKSTVVSVDIMADVGKKLVGPNVYRVYGPARHATMRQKMNIKNNVMCNLVITPEVFSKFSRKGGVLVDYQWVRYPFHIMNFEDTPSFQSWLCAAIHLAKTTFISFPPVDVFVDRDRVARNILGATPLKNFIEESVASCSNDKVEIEMFKTPPKTRRLVRIDLVNTNLLSSHSCSDVYDSLECEPSPFDKADCSSVEEAAAAAATTHA